MGYHSLARLVAHCATHAREANQSTFKVQALPWVKFRHSSCRFRQATCRKLQTAAFTAKADSGCKRLRSRSPRNSSTSAVAIARCNAGGGLGPKAAVTRLRHSARSAAYAGHSETNAPPTQQLQISTQKTNALPLRNTDTTEQQYDMYVAVC